MLDRVRVLETVADNAADHGFLPECAKHVARHRVQNAPSLSPPGVSYPPARVEQRRRGRSPHQNVIAFCEVWQSVAATTAR